MGQLLGITKWDSFITKRDSFIYYKVGRFYYKAGRVLQSGTILLQSGTGITKWDSYYKVGFNRSSFLKRATPAVSIIMSIDSPRTRIQYLRMKDCYILPNC